MPSDGLRAAQAFGTDLSPLFDQASDPSRALGHGTVAGVPGDGGAEALPAAAELLLKNASYSQVRGREARCPPVSVLYGCCRVGSKRVLLSDRGKLPCALWLG
jgi:hypothetical protein